MRRRSSGIIGLDGKLGGGYPHGCNVVLTGDPGAGKDLLLNLVIRENQRTYGDESAVLIVYLEQGGWDKQHARNVGVKVPYSKGEIAILEEQGARFTPAQKKAMLTDSIGNIDIAAPKTTEEALDCISEAASENYWQIAILNSIDAMSSLAESEAVAEDGIEGFKKGRGGEGRALILSAHYRNQNAIMMTPFDMEDSGELRETTFFWVSQYRMAHTSEYTTTKESISGGQSVQYYSALTLKVEKGKVTEQTYYGPADYKNPKHVPTSDIHRVYVKKGKYGIATGDMAEFRFYHHDHYENGKMTIPIGTIDESGTMRAELINRKWLVRRGREYHLHLPGDAEPIIIDGKRTHVDARFRQDHELRERIQGALINAEPETNTEGEEEEVSPLGEEGS